MSSLHRNVLRRKKSKVMRRSTVLRRAEFESLDFDTRIALIQQLVPVAAMAAVEEMEREVEELAGPWYAHDEKRGVYRNGYWPSSITLAGQRVPVPVPRVRSDKGEIPLNTDFRGALTVTPI